MPRAPARKETALKKEMPDMPTPGSEISIPPTAGPRMLMAIRVDVLMELAATRSFLSTIAGRTDIPAGAKRAPTSPKMTART